MVVANAIGLINLIGSYVQIEYVMIGALLGAFFFNILGVFLFYKTKRGIEISFVLSIVMIALVYVLSVHDYVVSYLQILTLSFSVFSINLITSNLSTKLSVMYRPKGNWLFNGFLLGLGTIVTVSLISGLYLYNGESGLQEFTLYLEIVAAVILLTALISMKIGKDRMEREIQY